MAPNTGVLIEAILQSAGWVIITVAGIALLLIALLYLFEMIKDRAWPVNEPMGPPAPTE